MEQRYRIELPELHPEQARIKAEAARFNVAECGRRFGKTVLGEDTVELPVDRSDMRRLHTIAPARDVEAG